MLLSLKNITVYVQDRCLFTIENLKVYTGDKIGVIGRNGAGKSTLLGIMAGMIRPDAGKVTRNCSSAYVTQIEDSNPAEISDRSYKELMSGGEKVRVRLSAAIDAAKPLLLVDEPTANLDIKTAELFQSKLQNYQGAVVVVSHDRQLLDAVCDSIWEIADGQLRIYRGNYSDYLSQKETERKQQEKEYEKYINTKQHLVEAIADRKGRSASTRKTPKRMGNSEARLHKMGNQDAKASLDKAVKAIESRLSKLEIKAKPKDAPTINFTLNPADGLHSKVVIRGEDINKSFGRRVLLKECEFSIKNGQKVALFGENGSGKTTLLKMINAKTDNIFVSPTARVGYFAQGMEGLDPDKSVLNNIMATSVQNEGFVRQILAQLLFRRDDVYKPVRVLSGGERVRVCLAKIIVSDANVLLLDEPTNFLDLQSRAALEQVLAEYDGTILFASHDRRFINKIATHLMVFASGNIKIFAGNYDQYLTASQVQNKAPQGERLIMEYRLAEVISRLSVAKDQDEVARLDEEYRFLLKQLR